MENTPNIVKINRFEAFALYKSYKEKANEAKITGSVLYETYTEKADKWLEIACEIEKADADDVNQAFQVLG